MNEPVSPGPDDARPGVEPGAVPPDAGAAPHVGEDTSGVLRAALTDLGVSAETVDRAHSQGTLRFLAVEHLALGEPLEHDLDGVAAATGLPEAYISALWRSLGFPQPRAGERIFTRADVELLRTVAELMARGVVEADLAMQMSRVIGSSLARVASAQLDALEAAVGAADDDAERNFMAFSAELLPAMPKIMEYVWRRHLQGAARQRVSRPTGGERDRMVVGFADMVGFTAMSQQLPSNALAAVVGRFETIAYDTVGQFDGRVVKMIGDEVMFATTREEAAVQIGLTLAEAYSDETDLSEVRVGVAGGEVLQREADLFGPVVNLASRIVNLAFPGSVVVSEPVYSTLSADEAFSWRSIGRRNLKGIGRVPLWVVRRSSTSERTTPPGEAPAGSRVHQREAVVDRLTAEATS